MKQYETAFRGRRYVPGRLWAFMEHFGKNICSLVNISNATKCEVCRTQTYHKWDLCRVTLHFSPVRGSNKDKKCFLHYHDKAYFGLAYQDTKFLGNKMIKWKPQFRKEIRISFEKMKKLDKEMN